MRAAFTVSGSWIEALGYRRGLRSGRKIAPGDAHNFARGVYQRLTLLAGDVFFDEVGVLQTGKFDGESVLDVTDHPALRLSDGNHAADSGP